MRHVKIIAIAFLLIVGPAILESCCLGPGACGCGDHSKAPSFNIDTMTLSLLPYPTTSTTVPTPVVFSGVIFMVDMEVTYTELMGSVGSTLLACSPIPPKANQTITDITISSNAMLEARSGNAPAGSNLNFVFEATFAGHESRPVEDLIGEMYLDRTFYFRSQTVLSRLQTHTFTFSITLSDGRVFSLVSSPLELG